MMSKGAKPTITIKATPCSATELVKLQEKHSRQVN